MSRFCDLFGLQITTHSILIAFWRTTISFFVWREVDRLIYVLADGCYWPRVTRYNCIDSFDEGVAWHLVEVPVSTKRPLSSGFCTTCTQLSIYRVPVRVPNCPEIPEILTLSWNCPEIRNCTELYWTFSHLVRMSWYLPSSCRSYNIAFILYLVTSYLDSFAIITFDLITDLLQFRLSPFIL